MGFPGGAVVKNLPTNAGDTRYVGLIPGWGLSFGIGNGNPLQYYCLENPMDRGALRVTVQEVEKSWTWLSGWAHIMGNIMSFHLCQCNGEQKETCFFFKPLRLTVFICLYIFYELAFMVFPHDVWNLFLQEIVIF